MAFSVFKVTKMKRKRDPRVEARLCVQTLKELQSHALARGVRPTVIVREALVFYLRHLDDSEVRRRERELSDHLEKATEVITQAIEMAVTQLASLVIKTAISAEATNEFLASDEKPRKNMEAARNIAVAKISRALEAEQNKFT
jgi:hypothetical protein